MKNFSEVQLKAERETLIAQLKVAVEQANQLKTELETLTAHLNTTQDQVKRLKADLKKEKTALRALKGSFSFQLVNMLILAVRRPGKNTLLAPYKVSRLIIQTAQLFIKSKYFKPRQPDNQNIFRKSLPTIPSRKTTPEICACDRTALMILYFSMPYHSNGYAIRSHGLLSSLKKTSWHVVPYTRPGYPWDTIVGSPGHQLECSKVDEITYHHSRFSSKQNIKRAYSNYLEYIEGSAKIIESLAKTTRPGLIHAVSNHLSALPALIAARRMGIPFIYEVRGMWEITEISVDPDLEHTEIFKLKKDLESLVAREADCIITLTQGLYNELISRGVKSENIKIVPNCVDVERFKPLPMNYHLQQKLKLSDVPTIGYVGSFSAYEGLDDLIRAGALLKDRGIKFNLLLVGDGKVMDELLNLARDLNVTKEVVFTGRVPHQDVEQYYSLIDIAPFPRKPVTVCEMVSPLKPLEAMAMRKTVIASSVGGLQEIVTHGETGLVFEKGNLLDLVDKLSQVITNKDLSFKLGENSQTWVREKRTWNNAAKEISIIYDNIVSKTKKNALPVPDQTGGFVSLNHTFKIALYADADLNLIDGSSVWTATQAEALAGFNNTDIYLFLKSPESRTLLTDPLRKYANITIIDLDENDRLVSGHLSVESALDKIETQDRQLGFEAIILRGWTLCEEAARRSGLSDRIWTYITDLPNSGNELTPEILRKLKGIVGVSKYILCQTEEIRLFWVKNIPTSTGKMRILPVMIPEVNNQNKMLEDAPKAFRRICYAGKFHPAWGTLEMFKAFSSLHSAHPEVELHVFGDKIHNPPKMPGFQKTVLSFLNNTDGIVWHHGTSREEVLNRMAEMDIGWAWRRPDHEEKTVQLSTKVLEYGASGLPVILFRNTINEKLLGADYPLFANNYAELTALLNRVLESPEILRIASMKTKAVSAQFTINNVRENYIRPLFDQKSQPPSSISPSKRSLILVAGHDFKFINRLLTEFGAQGHDILIDTWQGHDRHNEQTSYSLLEKAEIIICEWCLGNAVWYSRNKRPDQKLVIRFHRQELESDYPASVVMHNVNKVIFVSPHIQRKAVSRFNWDPWVQEKLVLIPNYVDGNALNQPKLNGAQFNLGICGIVPQMKRFDRALDILKILRRKDSRFHLYVKGRMPHEYSWMQRRKQEMLYYAQVMERVQASDLLKDAVHFEGWGDDMPQWYQKIGFMLSTSDFEAFHLTVAESAASGCIPVLLRWEGADEIYPRDWIVNSTGEVADAIMDIVRKGIFQETGRARQTYARENFDIELVSCAWQKILTGQTKG
jgi:PEP-CTERM/exosortase A-associated glycosyltransferase